MKTKKQFDDWYDKLSDELKEIQNRADLNNIGYNEEQLEVRIEFVKLVKNEFENLIKEECKKAYGEGFQDGANHICQNY